VPGDSHRLFAVSPSDVKNGTLPAGESFRTVEAARSGEVLRGLSFTPGTPGTAARRPATADSGTGGRDVPAARSVFSVRLRWC
jgi:hypothetical protein